MNNILIRPVFTERSMKDAEDSRFTFVVALSASKDEIKKTVETQFNVKVLDIATVIVKGKGKRVGKKRTKKILGKYKKAVISLVKGQKIEVFDMGEKKGK